ncbi:MAG: enoyl-CoA hydratase [Burkholderiaceae bacterium]
MATVHVDRQGPVVHLVIDNPAKFNAMTLGMWQTIAQTVAEAESQPEARVLVLRGAGDKAFVSGADISEFESRRSDPAGVTAYDDAVRSAQAALAACSMPVIAVIRGVCMGGGIGLALAADLRYCAGTARFRMPAARLGLGYGFEGMERAVQRVGAARAAELFLTARTFDGAEAQRIGLVNEAFDADRFDEEVESRIAMVAGNAPLTMAAAKLAISQAALPPADRDLHRVNAAVRACFESEDYKEGRRAFMEKRAPQFKGH